MSLSIRRAHDSDVHVLTSMNRHVQELHVTHAQTGHRAQGVVTLRVFNHPDRSSAGLAHQGAAAVAVVAIDGTCVRERDKRNA